MRRALVLALVLSSAAWADVRGPATESLPEFAATYHELPSPLVFRVPAGGRSPQLRARDATSALTGALERATELDEVPPSTVVVEDGRATVRVAGEVVATLYDADARAEGMTLTRFSEKLEGQLESFVPAQLQRKSLQNFALHVFLSVLLSVIAFLTLRGLRATFDRWDAELHDKRGSLKAISLLRIPVFSGDALGGTLAFGLATGRVLAYVATVVAAIVAVLSQFETTRPLLRQLGTWSVGPVVRGAETVVTALPGVVLAAVLIVALHGSLRVFNLLLDGVASKRLHWKRLPPERVPAFRFASKVVVILVLAPLFVASAFGRFGTPLETLALATSGAVLVAIVPLLASYVVGVFVLWRDAVRPGDWVQVGAVSGEVTRLSFYELHLVPEGGGTIGVPMLYLLLHPLRRLSHVPEVTFDVELEKDRPAKEILDAVTAAVRASEAEASAEVRDVCGDRMTIQVRAPSIRSGVRQNLLLAVSDAADREELRLPCKGR
jgi:small-conductance mechanosensitive channel